MPPPVVLHHGLFGSGDIRVGPVTLRYFRGIDRAIADRGHPVIVPWVHPCSSVENRARQLKEHVIKQLRSTGREGERAILIGHSMGGLDARFAVSQLGLHEHVSAVVTVSTPHRGSPFADFCLRNLGDRLGLIPLLTRLGLDVRAVADLTTAKCAQFNRQVPDVAGVAYYSVTAARPWFKMPPFAMHSHAVVRDAEGPNDGLVSIRSGTWGTHLGTWPADHWHTINRKYMPDLSGAATGSIIPHWLRLLDAVTDGLAGGTLACSTSPSSAAA